MALFANITAADIKKRNIIMFAMVSSCPDQVDPWADQILGDQFACNPVYYGVFLTIVYVTNVGWGGDCGVCFGNEKGFLIGLYIKLTYIRSNTMSHILFLCANLYW